MASGRREQRGESLGLRKDIAEMNSCSMLHQDSKTTKIKDNKFQSTPKRRTRRPTYLQSELRRFSSEMEDRSLSLCFFLKIPLTLSLRELKVVVPKEENVEELKEDFPFW